MRFFRITLLSTYFLNKKNKKKAINIINIGIFLSIFALSSAIISFFIEKKIGELQFSLIEYIQEKKEINNSITLAENEVLRSEFKFRRQSLNIREQSLFIESDYGNKLLTYEDIVPPFVYYTLKDLELLNELLSIDNMKGFEFFDYFDESIKSLYKEMPLRLEAYEKNLVHLKEEITFLNKLNRKDYKNFIFNPNYKQINKNLNTFSSKQIYKNEIYDFDFSDFPDDYTYAYDYTQSSIFYWIDFIDLMRWMVNDLDKNIIEVETEILKNSKLEKNLILITFIFQFIIFCIIQIFEFASVNQSKKYKLL